MANNEKKHPKKTSHRPSLYAVLNAFRSAFFRLIFCDMTDLLKKPKITSGEYFEFQSTLKTL
jgi:hypothetical protein